MIADLLTQCEGEYQPASNDRGRVVRYKFAFQWCPSQGEPWWTRQMPLRNDLSESQLVNNYSAQRANCPAGLGRVSDEQQGNLNSASERGQESGAIFSVQLFSLY